MNRDFKIALEKRRILPFPEGKKLISKEISAAEDDLNEARDRFEKNRFKYSTITSYYSMFHAARALLFAKGYREKSHYYLHVAIEALYVDDRTLSPELARNFKNAMILREEADYHGDFSETGAKTVLEAAQKFLSTAKKILKI